MIVLLLLVLSVLAAWHTYLWSRLVQAPLWPLSFKRVATVLMIVLALSIPLSMIASRMIPGTTGRILALIGFVWIGLAFYLTLFLGFTDLVQGLWGFGQKTMDALIKTHLFVKPDLGRRQFLARMGAGLALTAASGMGLWAVLSATASPKVKRVEVFLDKLNPKHSGFSIVQLSDLHIGKILRGDFVRDVVDKVNALKPDLVVITGDLVDGRLVELQDEVAALKDIVAAHGVYFVTGNHEYYSGAAEWEQFLPRLGVEVLHNQSQIIADGAGHILTLLGIPDESARRFPGQGEAPDIAQAVKNMDREIPSVLLAHQPKVIDQAARQQVDLTFSGHTHGGQIWPFGALVMLNQPYLAGLHRRHNSQIYVSRGTGFWGPPMRLAAPAEISQIILRSSVHDKSDSA